MDLHVLLAHCRLADGRLVDVGIAGGHIAAIGEDTAPSLSNRVPILDIGSGLLLPGLVDGHMHPGKTMMGLPWMPHAAGPARMSRTETDKTILPYLPASAEERAGNLIEACVARGTAHLRTHVDIDFESRLAKLNGVLAARERRRRQVNVQIVAFPQSGVMRCAGVLDLLDAAVCESADLVGGIEPLEIDRDPKGQLVTASGVPEAIAAHPSRKLVLFGRIVARDSAIFPAPAPIA
jgi:cytosine deaminase